MNMAWLIEKIDEYDKRTAIIANEVHYSFSDLGQSIRAYRVSAGGIIPSGSVVGLCSDYSFSSIALLFALMFNKNIVVPITTTVEEEIGERVKESQADYVLRLNDSGEIYCEQVQNATETKHALIESLRSSENSGLVLFSSGSTGKPKAMIHNLDALAESYRDRRAKDLVMLVFLMFDHIGGLNTLFNSVSMGTTIIIPENREPDSICALIEKHAVNILPSSPTFLNLLFISGALNRHNLSSIKMVTYGTEPMPESLLLKLKAVFPRVKFLQTFGTSETGIAQTNSKSSSSTLLRIEDGVIEHKIVNGELWLRSKTQILGYLNSSMESFTEDGWFKTGDLVDEVGDGYIKIIGRNKEIINVGGEKVLPTEVESVLLQIPEILDCIVYGERSSIVGQIVVADVVLRADIDKSEIKRIVRTFCKNHLASYKIPVKINVVEQTNFNDRFKKIRRNLST